MDNGFAEGYAVGQGNSNNGYGMGYGAWGEWIWIIVLFALWGNGGFGFGGNNGALTRADLCSEMGFNNLENGVRGISQGICDSTFALNNTMTNGFANVQSTLCQGFYGTQTGIMQNGYETRGAINDLGYRLQDCCCQTQRAIEGVNANIYKSTCDITNAINGSTNTILGYLTQEKISALQSENALLTAQLSQNSQTANINATIANAIEQLRPVAKPAYLTCSPFESVYGGYGYGRNGYNNGGCGCGCNSGCGC